TQSATGEEKTRTISHLAEVIRSEPGNPESGQIVYQRACGICHTLKGEGGQIGPDLTGYDRRDLPLMLLQVVDPNADIREGYVNYRISTRDGRTLAGFLKERTENGVAIQPYGSEPIRLSAEEIEKIEPQQTSLMPEGILENLSDEEVRDLFAYLMEE